MTKHNRKVGRYEYGFIAVARMSGWTIKMIAQELKISEPLVFGYLSGQFTLYEDRKTEYKRDFDCTKIQFLPDSEFDQVTSLEYKKQFKGTPHF